MADLGSKQRSGTQRIVGGNEGYAADVKQSAVGLNELYTADLENKSLLKALIFQLTELNTQMRLPKEKTLLVDGFGTGLTARIDSLGSIKVNSQNTPDPNDPIIDVPLSGYLADVNGNIDARANGSVTPVDFFLAADPNLDTYVASISFKIADANATLNDFGAIASLTNGFDIIYSTQETGERVLATGLKSNFDIIRICQGLPAFSQGVESFRASNVVGGSEGYIPVLRIKDNFGLPYGLRLRKGTKDKLILRVNDDITAVDAFDIFYYGIQKI